jgi:hypothetical protein
MKNMKTTSLLFMLILLINMSCKTQKHSQAQRQPEKVEFNKLTVSNDGINMWARAFGDFNGDGILDIVAQNNNREGGWLAWYETGRNIDSWNRHIIAGPSETGEEYASGDTDVGDFNNDGKMDFLGFVHGGETGNERGVPTKIYWFENPCWERHYIGDAVAFIKDVEVADFNQDGKLDIAVVTHAKNSIQVFSRVGTNWKEVLKLTITDLHEGMGTGNLDGDGYPDIAMNGYWLKSPGKDLSKKWELNSVDEKWHNQTGDWAKNSTKIFCADIDKDGNDEVFISHSERKDYPVAWYDLVDTKNNEWKEYVIGQIDGCHTLQVFDFNNDGHLDVLAGENSQRWGGEDTNDPVILFLNNGDNINFTEQLLSDEGIYNGVTGDINNDGHVDFMRISGHTTRTLEIWINQK